MRICASVSALCVLVSLAMPVCPIGLHVGVGCLLGSCVVALIMDKVGLPYRLMSQCDSVSDSVICWMNPQVLDWTHTLH